MALPPDLSRIGDELAAAASRSLRTRHRRALAGRAAVTAVAAALALAALAPARLGTAQGGSAGGLGATVLASTTVHAGCDQLRGAQPRPPACVAAPAVEHQVRATLPHGTPPLAE
jgi:hypothetical protein